MKIRSINDDWEISQEVIDPAILARFPILLKQKNIMPYFSQEKYVQSINRLCREGNPQQASYKYDEIYHMPGIISNAKIINDEVWVTFVPKKFGNYWLCLPMDRPSSFENYNENLDYKWWHENSDR